jgi:hypothetical protein
MIVLVAMYTILLTTMILSDLWKWHDSTKLLLHASLLTGFFLLFGLFFWFGERWKYFRITCWVLLLIFCVGSTIHDWQKGDPWRYVFYPIWFVWGLFSLKEEIVKLMTHNGTQNERYQQLDSHDDPAPSAGWSGAGDARAGSREAGELDRARDVARHLRPDAASAGALHPWPERISV